MGVSIHRFAPAGTDERLRDLPSKLKHVELLETRGVSGRIAFAGRSVNSHTMLRFILPFILVTSAFAQTADPKPLVDKAVNAVGGKDKLLKIFRIKEIFHFGSTPDPAEGKKRSTRESILSQPDKWWINKKERGVQPAKDDV